MEPKVESMQTRKLYWMLIRKGSGTQNESQMTKNSIRRAETYESCGVKFVTL